MTQESLVPDIFLTLKDGTNEITFPAHKDILSTNSPYFNKLFTWPSNEKNQINFFATVPNVYAVYDIILEFYGDSIVPIQLEHPLINKSEWPYQLDLIKCYDYLNIKCDQSLLKNIHIPSDNFDLLLDVIDIIGYDKDTIQLISDNLPENYDISKFPKELVDEIIKINTTYKIITSHPDKNITVWNPWPHKENPLTKKTIVDFGFYTRKAICIDYSHIYHQIACGYGDNMIRILDASTGELIRILEDDHCAFPFLVRYSPDNHQIILVDTMGKIICWDTLTGDLIYAIPKHNRIQTICYSPNGKQIVSGGWGTTIRIHDALTGKLLQKLSEHTDWVIDICYSPDGMQMASGSHDGTITIWNTNLERKKILHNEIKLHDHAFFKTRFLNSIICTPKPTRNVNNSPEDRLGSPLIGICYSPDSKRIASVDYDHWIKIWDSSTGDLISTIDTINEDLINIHDTINKIKYLNNQIIMFVRRDNITFLDTNTGKLISKLNIVDSITDLSIINEINHTAVKQFLKNH